jgi:hypothetical protein
MQFDMADLMPRLTLNPNQSTARKSDQSDVAITGRLANQNLGKRTNQKAGYKKKQSIDCRDSHFIRHIT